MFFVIYTRIRRLATEIEFAKDTRVARAPNNGTPAESFLKDSSAEETALKGTAPIQGTQNRNNDHSGTLISVARRDFRGRSNAKNHPSGTLISMARCDL